MTCLPTSSAIDWLIDWLMDWLKSFTTHLAQNRSFWRRNSQPVFWLSTEKLTLQNQTCIRNEVSMQKVYIAPESTHELGRIAALEPVLGNIVYDIEDCNIDRYRPIVLASYWPILLLKHFSHDPTTDAARITKNYLFLDHNVKGRKIIAGMVFALFWVLASSLRLLFLSHSFYVLLCGWLICVCLKQERELMWICKCYKRMVQCL